MEFSDSILERNLTSQLVACSFVNERLERVAGRYEGVNVDTMLVRLTEHVLAFAIRQHAGSTTHRYTMDRNTASLGLFEKYLKQRRMFYRWELE